MIFFSFSYVLRRTQRNNLADVTAKKFDELFHDSGKKQRKQRSAKIDEKKKKRKKSFHMKDEVNGNNKRKRQPPVSITLISRISI